MLLENLYQKNMYFEHDTLFFRNIAKKQMFFMVERIKQML